MLFSESIMILQSCLTSYVINSMMFSGTSLILIGSLKLFFGSPDH